MVGSEDRILRELHRGVGRGVAGLGGHSEDAPQAAHDRVETGRRVAVGPLKDMGRWLAFGVVGVILLSIGMLLLLVGLLRLLQTETSAFEGNWSWVPYLITMVVAVIVIVIALSRIKKLEFEAGEPRS